MAAIVVNEQGVRPGADVAEVEKAVALGGFLWLDIVGEDDVSRTSLLKALGFEHAEIAAMLRFRQTGRFRIARDWLRAVTWISDGEGAPTEIHVSAGRNCLVSMWSGDETPLDPIRRQFSERIAGAQGDMHYAAALLLQLLIGTLDASLEMVDARIDALRLEFDLQSSSMDYSLIARSHQRLLSFTAGFSRYSSAVRSAMVGVESLPGMSSRAAAELNDYVDLVEDFEEQLFERRRWLSDITHDFSTAVAQRQSDQISRLTIVSLIFLPLTALTGFFGMNFAWLSNRIASEQSFFVFGLLLPALGMILTVAWLARKGLMRLDLWW
jgi:Mg2+ and Co2+ transporter CorA